MSAFFFGAVGTIFSICWLVWLLENKRTTGRGILQESVTCAAAPGRYWGEVAFAGLFAILCMGIAGDAVLEFWN